jgi:hypothetical protein
VLVLVLLLVQLLASIGGSYNAAKDEANGLVRALSPKAIAGVSFAEEAPDVPAPVSS